MFRQSVTNATARIRVRILQKGVNINKREKKTSVTPGEIFGILFFVVGVLVKMFLFPSPGVNHTI